MQWVAPQGKKAMRFYEKLGAHVLPRWSVFRMDSSCIQDLANDSQTVGIPGDNWPHVKIDFVDLLGAIYMPKYIYP